MCSKCMKSFSMPVIADRFSRNQFFHRTCLNLAEFLSFEIIERAQLSLEVLAFVLVGKGQL